MGKSVPVDSLQSTLLIFVFYVILVGVPTLVAYLTLKTMKKRLKGKPKSLYIMGCLAAFGVSFILVFLALAAASLMIFRR